MEGLVICAGTFVNPIASPPPAGPDVEVCDSDVVWYVLLRAVDLFHSEFRCYPGYFAGQVETDIMRLKVWAPSAV